jgi:1,2-dihydroxy-3-keto-5-methylthiopentene dioxygenase
MATLTIRQENRTLTEADAISRFLGQFGIWYRRSDLGDELGDAAGHEEILAAYEEPIRELEAEGGYVTADVIDITPETPNLEVMLARFDKEHWHDEDEVRFIVAGRGLFHIHPAGGPVFSLEIEAGDMINVPRGTHHWFDLCDERRIRAIRLFQDTSGWTPHYTGSGEETKHQPLCFGPAYIGVERVPEKLRP